MIRILFIFFLLVPLSVFARVNIYLIPEVETDKKNLTLSDIASIDDDRIMQAGKIIIPQLLYKDCLIDRKELNEHLATISNQSFTIFGNGVKIRFKETEKPLLIETKEEKPVIVKKGEIVELVIRNKKISIEMSGKSLDNGTEEDEISVRLKNGKVLKGKPLGSGKVAVIL